MANLQGMYSDTDPVHVPFIALPAGDYLAAISESETKPTKAGDGTNLELTFQIIEGEHKGRTLKTWMSLEHKIDKYAMVARSQFATLRAALGLGQVKDSIELHNLPVIITVICKPRKDTGEISNSIKSFASRNGARPTVAPATGAGPKVGGQPWSRK